jgi:hypothetical protein
LAEIKDLPRVGFGFEGDLHCHESHSPFVDCLHFDDAIQFDPEGMTFSAPDFRHFQGIVFAE